MSSDDTSFVIDEVSNIIKDTIEKIIGGNSYQHNKVNRWTADIVDHVLTELTRLGKPFKYIVQAVCQTTILSFFYRKLISLTLGDHAKEWRWFTYS